MLKFKTFKGNDIEIDTKKKKIYGGGGKEFTYDIVRVQKGLVCFGVGNNQAIALDKTSSEKWLKMEKEEQLARWKASAEATKARRAKVSGLEELEIAYRESNEAYHSRRRAIESGVSVFRATKDWDKIIDELCKKYPRAAVWHKADAYTSASNYAKSAAGEKAKKIIENGGSLKDAEAILKNWTDDVYID